jgi:hypothetical protein
MLTLAAAKAVDGFNADYYLAIVTILPILMVATGILADFAKSLSRATQARMKAPFYFLVSFLYLWSPAIAAFGVITGVLALMRRNGDGAYQWITFICLVIVLIFLAIASGVSLLASDPVKDAHPTPKIFKIFKKRKTGDSTTPD